MNIVVRAATPEDAAGIVAVVNPIIQAGRFTVLDTPLTVDEERRFIAGLPARSVFHVAAVGPGGPVVGFQVLEPFAAYSVALAHVATVGTFVDLSLQRRGVGRALFAETAAAARRNGFEKILTYVRADNSGALSFYRRLGFRTVGTARRQAKLGCRYVDEVVIEAFLTG